MPAFPAQLGSLVPSAMLECDPPACGTADKVLFGRAQSVLAGRSTPPPRDEGPARELLPALKWSLFAAVG